MRPTEASNDRPEYPNIRERFHEDPAQFICTKQDLAPHIRGMFDIGRVNAWIHVARDVDARPEVIEALEQRRDNLIEDKRAAEGGGAGGD